MLFNIYGLWLSRWWESPQAIVIAWLFANLTWIFTVWVMAYPLHQYNTRNFHVSSAGRRGAKGQHSGRTRESNEASKICTGSSESFQGTKGEGTS